MPKPIGPGGLPLPRPDNAVTWAITPENRPIPDGRPAEQGPLNLYNYADYVDPVTVKKFSKLFNTSVSVATYNSADEAIAKLASGAVGFDVIVGLTGSNIVNLIAQKPAAAAQPLVPAEPREERLAASSRTRSTTAAAATPCRTSSGWTASAGETTRSRPTSPRWTSRGTSSGTRSPTAASVGVLDDKRDALSMPMQRDAMHAGVRPDLNTEDAR